MLSTTTQQNEATPIVPAPFPSLKWEWALRDDPDVQAHVKTLGLWLATFAGPDGHLRPTVDRLRLLIANDKGQPVGEKTIDRRRRELVRRGWITLVKRGRGRGQASVYQLSWPSEKRVTGVPGKRVTSPPENGSAGDPLRETVVKDSLSSERELVVDDEVTSSPLTGHDDQHLIAQTTEGAAPNADGAALKDLSHGARIPVELDIHCRSLSDERLLEIRDQPRYIDPALSDAAKQGRHDRQELRERYPQFLRAAGASA